MRALTPLPITEESAVDRSEQQIEYGLHKLLCEDRLLEEFASTGFPATTVALSMVMGPRNIVPDREQRMFVRLLRARPVLLLGRGTALGQIGDVDDQAEALCDVMGQAGHLRAALQPDRRSVLQRRGVRRRVRGRGRRRGAQGVRAGRRGRRRVGRAARARTRASHRRAHRHPHHPGRAAHAGDGDPSALPAHQPGAEARAAPAPLGRQRAVRHRQARARCRLAPAAHLPRDGREVLRVVHRASRSPSASPSTSRSRTNCSSTPATTTRSDHGRGRDRGQRRHRRLRVRRSRRTARSSSSRPGGRFSKDFGGIHELADALAEGGKRVLLWDRPNCGRSDVQFYGRRSRTCGPRRWA